MESWLPLFDIFMNSLCPETEASLWLQKSFNPSSTPTISTSSFLSLLTKSTDAVVEDSSSPSPTPQTKRVMWMQTLPDMVQARILSFLAFDNRRFSPRKLSELARNVLTDTDELDFWVKRAAHQLLDVLPGSSYGWVSCMNLDSEEEKVDNEFCSLPDWLKDAAASSSDLVLPWLPIPPEELSSRTLFDTCENDDEDSLIEDDDKEDKLENLDEIVTDISLDHPKNNDIEPEIQNKANELREKILLYESTSKTVALAHEIRQICIEKGVDAFKILGLIEPWKADDETSSILISHLTNGNEDELGWPSYVLSSVILPKLLLLKEPVSRVLMASTLEYCSLHQRAAEYSLLFPLIFRTEGINNPINDVITKIMRECLHTAHVSAFFQKLLCGEEKEEGRKFIFLPCHKSLISTELVWTESLFNLFQYMLNHNVNLTHDSVDQLVYRLVDSAERFSKSLKFGNFLLGLVNKCAPLLKVHKLLLIQAVESTNTIVTKSILSKLASL